MAALQALHPKEDLPIIEITQNFSLAKFG